MKLIDRKCAKNSNATELDKMSRTCPKYLIKFGTFLWHFHFLELCLSIHFIDTSPINFCDTWSVHPFHRHFLYTINAYTVLQQYDAKYKNENKIDK